MKIDQISIDGSKKSLEVTDKIFTSRINKKLISEILYSNIANYKGRKAKTKQKNEIIGSTSKIYAQKGTGNARHASRKAPIFIGGGVAHGPKGENAYKKRKLNKNIQFYIRIGYASALFIFCWRRKNVFLGSVVFDSRRLCRRKLQNQKNRIAIFFFRRQKFQNCMFWRRKTRKHIKY